MPSDNPFVNMANRRPEIWAFGLRNPFRFSFDRQTGQLWVGDVGQNQFEEIDIVTKGANYGWPAFEGNHAYLNVALAGGIPHTPPVHEYDHSDGIAVIGGYVYRGSQFASLFGRYLYTDFGSGTVWAIDTDGANNGTIAMDASPTSFGEDNAGELYVVSQTGRIDVLNESGGGGSQPVLLSQTGLFTNLANLTPRFGLDRVRPESSVLVRWCAEASLAGHTQRHERHVLGDRQLDVSGRHGNRQTLRDGVDGGRSEFPPASRNAFAGAHG